MIWEFKVIKKTHYAEFCMCVGLQILYARDVDQRSTTFEKSLQMGKEFQRRTKAMILRAAVLRNQIHVKVMPCLNCHSLLNRRSVSHPTFVPPLHSVFTPFFLVYKSSY